MELFLTTGTLGDLAPLAFGLVLISACIAQRWKKSKIRREREEEENNETP